MNLDTEAPTRGYTLGNDGGVDGRGPEVKCSAASTAGSLALYRTVVDGQGPPSHRHTNEDETIFVLEGTMQAECGEDRWTGGRGTTLLPTARADPHLPVHRRSGDDPVHHHTGPSG